MVAINKEINRVMKFRSLIFILYCFVISSQVLSENRDDACSMTKGQQVKSITTTEQLTELFSELPLKKDEFEATSDFLERRDKLLGNAKTKGLVIKTVKDSNSIRYDADNSRFYFSEYFFSNGSFIFAGEALRGSDKFDKVFFDYDDFEYKVLLSQDQSLGTYSGENRMGAKFSINKEYHKRIVAIQVYDNGQKPSRLFGAFDGKGKFPSRRPGGSEDEADVFYLSVDVSRARELKDKLQPAFVVDLKEPYKIVHSTKISPTSNNPRDADVDLEAHVVEFRCALLLDGENTILRIF
jgi:hypothetical protein